MGIAEAKGKVMLAMANAGARNRGIGDRICRALLGTALAPPRRDNFMADPEVDSDLGFSLDELRQHQQAGRGGSYEVVED